MSNSIRISPKHGLNPSMSMCFWCGEDKNEIALLGKIDKNDSEAPSKCITDYEPCDKCRKIMDTGICFMEVSDEPLFKNQPPISRGYLTSRFVTLVPEALEHIVSDEAMRASILEHRKAYVEPAVMDMLIGSNKDKEVGHDTQSDTE